MHARLWIAAVAALALTAFGPTSVEAQRRAQAPGVTRTVGTSPSGERVRTTRRVTTRPNGTRVVERRQVRTGQRGRTALFVDCGDAREVHDLALLLGFGCDGCWGTG